MYGCISNSVRQHSTPRGRCMGLHGRTADHRRDARWSLLYLAGWCRHGFRWKQDGWHGDHRYREPGRPGSGRFSHFARTGRRVEEQHAQGSMGYGGQSFYPPELAKVQAQINPVKQWWLECLTIVIFQFLVQALLERFYV